jgi:hypothetical protein
MESEDTYDKLTVAKYHALQRDDAPQAIPTMCMLTIKPDKMMCPHRAKARIVVLGNHKDQIWTKSEKYALLLCPDTLQLILSMAVEHHRTLKQGEL